MVRRMNKFTLSIVGVLLCLFIILDTYAIAFKPRNDRFDDSAARVLSR